jgi:hypothetical protein
MEHEMKRPLLFACVALAVCLAFAAILRIQSDLATAGEHAQTSTPVAQDDSGDAQTAPNPSTSDTGNSNDSGKSDEDQE